MSDSLQTHGVQHTSLHHLADLVQTHVHWVSDAIQPSCPLLSPPPPALYLSQDQGLFQWVSFPIGGQSIGASTSVSILLMNIQGCYSLGLTGLISLQSKGLSGVFSNTTVLENQFFRAQPSVYSKSHPYMITGKVIALTIWILVGKVMSVPFDTLSNFVITILSRRASMVVQMVNNPPTMQETQVWSLGWEDPLEKEMATHSSIQSLHYWVTNTHTSKEQVYFFIFLL